MCKAVRCRDATVSSFVANVWGEVFADFCAVIGRVTVICGIGCFACQDESFLNNFLDVEENDEHALDIFFTYLAVSGLGGSGHGTQTPVYGLCFLPRTLV
jgi:hypothetical protein